MLVELSGFTVDSILNDRFKPIYTWGAPPFITCCMAILGRPFSPQVRPPPEDCEEAMSVASRSFLDTVLRRLQGASRCQIHPNTILSGLEPFGHLQTLGTELEISKILKAQLAALIRFMSPYVSHASRMLVGAWALCWLAWPLPSAKTWCYHWPLGRGKIWT